MIKSSRFIKKLVVELSYDPGTSLIGMYAKGLKVETCTSISWLVFCFVFVFLIVNLIQAKVIWDQGTSSEKMPPSGCRQALGAFFKLMINRGRLALLWMALHLYRGFKVVWENKMNKQWGASHKQCSSMASVSVPALTSLSDGVCF